MPRALIFGACGQDGPYLARELHEYGWEVVAVVPEWDLRAQSEMWHRFRHWSGVLHGDLLDPHMPSRLIGTVLPDAVYNLAAITFVPTSWDQTDLVMQSNGLGAVRIMEAVKALGLHDCRVYQASTSEMFGQAPAPMNERTPFLPISPYAAAKLSAHAMCRVMRESYGLHVVSGILFNHESRWRGAEFVTRQVTMQTAEILAGRRHCYELGNVDAIRDWGFAGDYVKAMVAMMEEDDPDDYVIGTGRARSVEDLVRTAAGVAGLDEWTVDVDVSRLRPVETSPLIADATRATMDLGWEPETTFEEMIEDMIEADRDRLLDKVPTP